MGDFDKFGAVVKSVGCTLTLKSMPNFFCDLSINLTNADKHYWNRFDNPVKRLKFEDEFGPWKWIDGNLYFGADNMPKGQPNSYTAIIQLDNISAEFIDFDSCSEMLVGDGLWLFPNLELSYKIWWGCV
jgi:hypothetical protein